MKKFYKGLGVALIAAMAVTAVPVSETFVRPAVVKASTTLQGNLDSATKAFIFDTGSKKDMLEFESDALFGGSGSINSGKTDYGKAGMTGKFVVVSK